MTKNSVSISMTKLRNDAFLAEAGYENMGGKPKDLKVGGIITNDATNSSFEVYNQAGNDSSGFSATVFRNIPKGAGG